MTHLICRLLLVVVVVSCIVPAHAHGRILIINSYDAEYSWSAGILAAIDAVLKPTGIPFETFHMDTKRQSSPEAKQQAGLLAKQRIAAYGPDVIITVDDNAQTYVGRDYAGGNSPQVVFCGVNNEPEKYGYTAGNSAGILEHTYPEQVLALLKRLVPSIHKVAHLSDTSPTATLINRRTFQQAENGQFPVTLVSFGRPATFAEWKAAIAAINADDSIGAIFVPVYHTVQRLADPNAGNMAGRYLMQWTVANTDKPVVGVGPFLPTDGGLLAVVSDPKEHGQIAAVMAIQLVGGKTVSELPMVINQKGKVILNVSAAEHWRIPVPFEILQSIDQIVE